MKAFNWKKPAMLVLAVVLAGQGAWEHSYRPGMFHPHRELASALTIADQIKEYEKSLEPLSKRIDDAVLLIKKSDLKIEEYLSFKDKELPEISEKLKSLDKQFDDLVGENTTAGPEDSELFDQFDKKILATIEKLKELEQLDSKSNIVLKTIVSERESNKKELETLKESLCEQRTQMDNLVEKIEHLIEKQEKVISYVDPMGTMDFMPSMASPFGFGFGMPNMFSMGMGMNSPMLTWNLFNMYGMQMNMHNMMSMPSMNYQPQIHNNYYGMDQKRNFRAPSIVEESQFSLLHPDRPEIKVPFIQPGMRSPIQADFIQLDGRPIQNVDVKPVHNNVISV